MKNPDIKNLRVAVVPTETGNGITQSSTVEEILNCDETQLYALTDYFKAQNDEELDLLHWSFLIDIETKEDLTGCNINGIHQNNREAKISKIKSIIANWGATTASELELESSPCLNSIGNGKVNVSELVEEFYADRVETITYQDELDLGYNSYTYEELPDDIIDEIYDIIVRYDVDMNKTMDRCED